MRVVTLLTLGVLTAASTGCMSDVKSSDGAKTLTYDCWDLAKVGEIALRKLMRSAGFATTRFCRKKVTRMTRPPAATPK